MDRDHTYALLGGVLLGAAAAYFLDPQSGADRRRQAGESLGEVTRAAEEGVARILGVSHPAETTAEPPVEQDPLKLFLEGRVDDRRLVERVQAALRHLSRHPEAIQVTARDGVVSLEGEVLETEVTDVLFGVRRVPGLSRLESRMRAVPSIGGEEQTLVQVDVSPAGAAAARALAGITAVATLHRRNLLGITVAVAAGLAVARAAGWSPARVTRRGRTITVQDSVEVDAPVERVFALWSSFRNLPRFMEHVLEVREVESGVSHWVAEDPEGNPITWDVEITALKPHRRIAWRTVEGSSAPMDGEVEFEPLEGERTRVTLTLSRHHTPRSAEAEALLGSRPQEQLGQDLQRLRALFPSSSPATA